MNKPRIVFKALKLKLTSDGVIVTANMYVNNVLTAYVTENPDCEVEIRMCISVDDKLNAVIKKNYAIFHEYIKTLPEENMLIADIPVVRRPYVEEYIGNQLTLAIKELESKEIQKRIKKLSKTCIVLGIEGTTDKLTIMDYKKPLSTVNKLVLQRGVDKALKHCTDGKTILNKKELIELGMRFDLQ